MDLTATQSVCLQDMPREKMLKYGPDNLTDGELLALVLGTGTREMNVLELADSIICRFGNAGLPYASCSDLSTYSGIGAARACKIAAAFELGKRFFQNKKTSIYMKPEEVWESMKDIRVAKREHFVSFYLDTKNQEIHREIISIGTLNISLVHPREVFWPAVRNAAASIIVAHNHPSGDVSPSRDDMATTKRLKEAGEILGIKVLDHVIVSREGYTSMKEQGLM